MRRRVTARRAAALAGVVLAISMLGAIAPRRGATAPVPVSLSGRGSWGPHAVLVPWQDTLIGAPSPIDMNYISNGSYLGRQDFLSGSTDFVISGTPFTADELKLLPGGADAIIAAPVQVTENAFLLSYPYDDFVELKSIPLGCNPDLDENCTQTLVPYSGPIRVPNENLAAMLFRSNINCGTDGLKTNYWVCPDIVKALGVEALRLDPNKPNSVVRSEPSASNYYLQQYAKLVAPGVWAALLTDPRAKWEPITERLPTIPDVSREGAEQQAFQLGIPGAATGSLNSAQGIVAAAPAWTLGAVHTAFPKTKVGFIQAQNANGDWVAPTPDSLTKAVAAGDDTPLYAATNKVENAYPATWVDKLYVKAGGLPIDKTEAMATMIRYLATAGQDLEAPQGEGRLSAHLVRQALDAADKVVQANCTGADRVITKSSDPGPMAPAALKAVTAIGPMLHCQAAPAATTAPVTTSPPATPTGAAVVSNAATTTTPTTPVVAVSDTNASVSTSVAAAVSSVPSASYVPGLSFASGSSNAGTASGVTAPATNETSNGSIPVRLVAGLLTAAKLPFPIPGTGSAVDVVTTLLLGALLFVVLFRFTRRMLAKARR